MFRIKLPLRQRIREAIKPTPLRKRLYEAIYGLRVQERRLGALAARIHDRDGQLYEKCLRALQRGDGGQASLYASECAQLRKIAKTILYCQLALERALLRMETVLQFGDLVYAVKPAAGVVKVVKHELEGIMPDISLELGRVNEELESLALNVGETVNITFNAEPMDEEAERILKEASALAEQKIKEKFPDLPFVATREAKSHSP